MRVNPALICTLLAGALFGGARAEAWIFPEHRDIGRTAIEKLDDNHRVRLEQIWKKANPAQSPRLCGGARQSEESPRRGDTPCADFGMLFAMAGDHACSPAQLEDTILRSDWFPKIPDFVAKLKKDLNESKDFENKLSLWNDSNVSLLKIDAEYLSRASSNGAHFPLEALPISAHETVDDVLSRSSVAGAPLNAVGIYARYHEAALSYARRGMAREAVLSEAFAIHFLEDLFAAGHYAGTWGDPGERKGTHDYYSAKGLITQTWGGERYNGHGDAFLTPDDLKHSSTAVRESLVQLIDAYAEPKAAAAKSPPNFFTQEVCKSRLIPEAPALTADERLQLAPVLKKTPIPSEGITGTSVQRYRLETGPFLSASSGLRFGAALGGFDGSTSVHRFELVGRFGFGTVGVLSDHSDGALFVEAGLIGDGQQYTNPQLDSRTGQKVGIRMPFWLIPGDFLLLGTPLYFINKPALQSLAISAANGGLLGLERKVSIAIGTLQFMAGRQMGVSLFGYLWNDPARITTGDGTKIGTYRSVELDFPLLEYEAGRAFANRLASDFTAQLGYAIDLPNSVTGANLKNSSVIYLRFSLEGIKYL